MARGRHAAPAPPGPRRADPAVILVCSVQVHGGTCATTFTCAARFQERGAAASQAHDGGYGGRTDQAECTGDAVAVHTVWRYGDVHDAVLIDDQLRPSFACSAPPCEHARCQGHESHDAAAQTCALPTLPRTALCNGHSTVLAVAACARRVIACSLRRPRHLKDCCLCARSTGAVGTIA